MKDVAHVTIQSFTLEACRGTAVTIDQGTTDRVAGCVISNTGAWAVRIGRSRQSGVLGCDITNTGLGVVLLEGGDRKTLTPAGLYAENNHIYHYSRSHEPLPEQTSAQAGAIPKDGSTKRQ